MPRILCAVLMLCLLSGCSSKELTEKTVRKVVNAKFAGEIASAPIRIGRIGSHCQSNDGGKIREMDLNPEKNGPIIVAQMAGYVAVTSDGPDYWRVSLTDKGKKAPNGQLPIYPASHNALNGCDFEIYRLALAHPEVDQVGEIARKEDASYTTFAWKWIPTDFGRALQKDGEIYSRLTPEQRSLTYAFYSPSMLVKFPLPTDENKVEAQFKQSADGQWTFLVR
jgi:hypothetical protein